MDEPQKPADQPEQTPEPVETPMPAEPAAAPPAEAPVQTEPTMPEHPVVATAPVLPPEAASRKKLSKLFLILAAVFLLAAVGVGAWYLTKDEDKPTSTAQSQTETEQTTGDTPAETEMKSTVFTSAFVEYSTAEVTHPTSWEVVETTEDFGEDYKQNHTAIGSPAGHWLHLMDVDGIGGTCDPDTKAYTLVKKLPTATEGAYFTEYVFDGSSRNFQLEDQTSPTMPEAHSQLQEGQSGTNVCDNISAYPTFGGVFVALSASKDRPISNTLSFADIADDVEFVEMLKSLKITDNTVQE